VEAIVGPLVMLLGNMFALVVLVYAVAALVVPTRWQVDGEGLTLRAASLLYVPVRVLWRDINWIRFGGGIVGYVALKLDGRYLFAPHVTLHRNGGLTRLVRFTPPHMGQIENAIAERLQGAPPWQRTDWGWQKCSPDPVEGRLST